MVYLKGVFWFALEFRTECGIIILADNNFKIFAYFSQKVGLHFMQIVISGDNLHEMSKPIFWEN